MLSLHSIKVWAPTTVAVLLSLIHAPSCCLHAQEKTTKDRTWTRTDGRTVQAELIGFDAGQVILRTPDQRVARSPINQLSPEDQRYVTLNIGSLVDPGGGAATPAPQDEAPSLSRVPVFSRTWPTTLTAPDGLSDARFLESESKPGKYLYRSRRFEYIVHAPAPLNAGVMKEVARVFEGTYELLSKSPIGIQASPVDGFFRADLYVTMEDYYKAGGPAGSGGVYKSSDKRFRVPFDSLGLRLGGSQNYVKDKDYQLKTLVHEITHMMMHDLLPLLPQWMNEGTAEYVECIPFKYGTFDHTKLFQSVKEYNSNRFNRRLQGPPIDDFARVLTPISGRSTSSRPEGAVPTPFVTPQSAFYHTSMLLTYYFMHLDGDGKSTRLIEFLNAVRQEKIQLEKYQRSFAVYRAALDEFLKNPEVKSFPDGRFSYPPHLKPPQAPKSPKPEYQNGTHENIHLEKLFAGRSTAQVASEAEAALTKLGLRTR